MSCRHFLFCFRLRIQFSTFLDLSALLHSNWFLVSFLCILKFSWEKRSTQPIVLWNSAFKFISSFLCTTCCIVSWKYPSWMICCFPDRCRLASCYLCWCVFFVFFLLFSRLSFVVSVRIFRECRGKIITHNTHRTEEESQKQKNRHIKVTKI